MRVARESSASRNTSFDTHTGIPVAFDMAADQVVDDLQGRLARSVQLSSMSPAGAAMCLMMPVGPSSAAAST
ncbi:MAG TPA: hypothetical protein VGC15_18375 [Acetobacteraceae bacterium]